MKRTLCLLVAVALCLTGCGEVDGVQVKQKPYVSTTSTTAVAKADTKTISNDELCEGAKAVVTEWFSLMSEAKYSEAAKLCSDELVKEHNLDEMTDGENQTKAVVEFTDEGTVCEKDGIYIITLKMKTYGENAPENSISGSFDVKYSDEKFLLDGVAEDDNGYIAKSRQKSAEADAKMVFIACETVLTQLENEENYKVAEGTYKKDDGSLFSERINTFLSDYDLGCTYDYEIVFADGETVVTFFDLDNNLTGIYPLDTQSH